MVFIARQFWWVFKKKTLYFAFSFYECVINYKSAVKGDAACAAAYAVRRLQAVLNAAARLIPGTWLNEHITPVLRDTLHWLPVTQLVDYKIVLMTYSCVHGTSPAYFNGICRPVASVEGCAMQPTTENSLSPEPEESATVHAASVLPLHLSGTIYHDISETMTLVVNNSLSIWRQFCLHEPIRQSRLWERLFKGRFINGLTYLLTPEVMWENVTHTHTHTTFLWSFCRTTRVSRCQKKSSGLYGAREDIRGIHTNNPAGRRSVWTNQRLTSFVPPFSRRMPFLLQPSQFILARDRHQICWLAYPVAWLWENIKQNIIWLCLYTSVWTACYMCMECWQRS